MNSPLEINRHAPAVTDPTQVDLHELISLSQFAQHFKLPRSAIKSQYKGSMLSAFKGRGMELADIRRFEEGDDVRDINWSALARTGEMYTNLYQEERERPLFLWVDQSRSMQFATRGRFKSVIAANLAALAGWHELKKHNRVGGFIATDQQVKHYNAARSRNGFIQLLAQLSEHQTATEIHPDGLNFYDKLQGLARIKHPGTALYLFSDFHGWNEQCRELILRLSRHQDVLLTLILDPIELHLPVKGHYTLSSGKQQLQLDTADRKRLEAYYSNVQQRVDSISQMAQYPGIEVTQVLTSDDPIVATFRALNEHRDEFTAGALA